MASAVHLVPREEWAKEAALSDALDGEDVEEEEYGLDFAGAILHTQLTARALLPLFPNNAAIRRSGTAAETLAGIVTKTRMDPLDVRVRSATLSDGLYLSRVVGAEPSATGAEIYRAAVVSFYRERQACTEKLRDISQKSGRIYVALEKVAHELIDALAAYDARIVELRQSPELLEQETRVLAQRDAVAKLLGMMAPILFDNAQINNIVSKALGDAGRGRGRTAPAPPPLLEPTPPTTIMPPGPSTEVLAEELEKRKVQWLADMDEVISGEVGADNFIDAKLKAYAISSLSKGEKRAALKRIAIESTLRVRDGASTTSESPTRVASMMRAMLTAVELFPTKLGAKSPARKALNGAATAALAIEYRTGWEYFGGARLGPIQALYTEEDARLLKDAWVGEKAYSTNALADWRDRVREAYKKNPDEPFE